MYKNEYEKGLKDGLDLEKKIKLEKVKELASLKKEVLKIYECNKEELKKIKKEIRENGCSSYGLEDESETFEQGYNNALEQVLGYIERRIEGSIIGKHEPQSIKVKDEVMLPNGILAVVTAVDTQLDKVSVLTYSGKGENGFKANALTKTGKQHDIETILEQLRKNNN